MQSVVAAGQAPITLQWKNISYLYEVHAVRGLSRTGSYNSAVEEYFILVRGTWYIHKRS